MIQWLIAKEEGPNTFWGRTVFSSLLQTRNREAKYRYNSGQIEVLLASMEGSNTLWQDFDPFCTSVEQLLKHYPSADSRAVLRVKP